MCVQKNDDIVESSRTASQALRSVSFAAKYRSRADIHARGIAERFVGIKSEEIKEEKERKSASKTFDRACIGYYKNTIEPTTQHRRGNKGKENSINRRQSRVDSRRLIAATET